jgi:hypothetical protein
MFELDFGARSNLLFILDFSWSWLLALEPHIRDEPGFSGPHLFDLSSDVVDVLAKGLILDPVVCVCEKGLELVVVHYTSWMVPRVPEPAPFGSGLTEHPLGLRQCLAGDGGGVAADSGLTPWDEPQQKCGENGRYNRCADRQRDLPREVVHIVEAISEVGGGLFDCWEQAFGFARELNIREMSRCQNGT